MQPRQVLPGQFYLLTRRCTQRQYLLRPDREANDTYLYCLGEAAQRFGIDVILPSTMSNHEHIVLFDRDGRVVEFMQHFHKMTAKALNALRGRWENFWSNEPPCLVRLVDRGDVLAKLVYAATNPVKAHLVERVHQWPGVNGLTALLNGRTIKVKRPRHFFREDGSMPAEVTLELALPPELGDPAQFLREVRARVADVEDQVRAERLRSGARLLGRRAVLAQSWRGQPSTVEPHRDLRPRIAARSVWSRVEALLRDRVFEDAYRAARLRLVAGLSTIFPPGTYWLRRFAGVQVATSAT